MRGERIVGGMRGHGMMMGSGMMGAMGFWSLLWVVVGLALLALVIAGTVWLAGRTGAPGTGAGEVGPDPVQILRRRYAAGEIDDGEYERRLTLLSR